MSERLLREQDVQAAAPAQTHQSLVKIMIRAARADVFRSLPFMPIYSAAEVALAFLAAALIRLVYIESPRVFVGDLVPQALQRVLEFPQTIDRKDLAFVVPLLIAGVGFIKLVSSFLSTYFMERAGYFVSTVLREQLLDKVLQTPAETLQAVNAGMLSNRIMADSATLQGAVSKGFLGGFRDLLVLVFCFSGMVFVAGKLFFLILACLLPFAMIVRYLSRVLQRHLSATATMQVELSAHAMDSRAGLLTLAAERTKNTRQADFARRSEALRDLARGTLGRRTLAGPFIEYLAVLGVAVLLAFKNSLGQVDVTTYSSLFILGAMTYRPLKNLGGVVSQFTEVRLTFQRMNAIWSRESAPLPKAEQLDQLERTATATATATATRSLVAAARSVDYVTESGVTLLSQASVEIRRNELVGFVGESGSGKTTMLRLLAGILRPSSGAVELPEVTRMATQSATIFAGSVSDNVVYNKVAERGQADQADLVHPVKQEIIDLMQSLGLAATPLGAVVFLERTIMPGGAGLSGGEKARVSIARVLAAAELDQEHQEQKGRSMLLLFDEPTANLDHESSALFWQTLKRVLSLHPWLAAVVITHHVSDLQHCNRHYVFDGGKVNEGK